MTVQCMVKKNDRMCVCMKCLCRLVGEYVPQTEKDSSNVQGIRNSKSIFTSKSNC